MRRTAVITLTVLGIVGLVLFLREIRSILLWILVGVILAIALEPAVGWLERHRWNRAAAALLVSLATVIGLGAVIVAVAWPVVAQADDFVSALPTIVKDVFAPGGELHFLEARYQVLEHLRSITMNQITSLLVGSQ